MAGFTAPGVSTGLTLVATTQTTFAVAIVDATLPPQKVKSLEASTMSTVGGMIYLASALIDNGELKLKIQNKVDLNPATFLGKPDTWTITFPLSGTGTVHATAAFGGFLMEYTPTSTAIDAIFEADIVIKVSGNITFTVQS